MTDEIIELDVALGRHRKFSRTMHIRLPGKLAAQLAAFAAKVGMPEAAIARRLIERALAVKLSLSDREKVES